MTFRPLRRSGVSPRVSAVEPERLDQLAHPDAGQLRIGTTQPVDLVLERIQLRARRRAPITRLLARTQRRAHRVVRQARPARQFLDRDIADEVLAPQLGLPLHVQHPSLPASVATTKPASTASRSLRQRPRGSNFNRRNGVSFQSAPTARRISRLFSVRHAAPGSEPCGRRFEDTVVTRFATP